MRPYSQDLRERVIATLEAGASSQAEVAETFAISQSTVEKWWHRWRHTGSCAASPHAGGMPRALEGCEAALRAEVEERPDVTLAELCEHVAEARDVAASPSMMCRELRRLGLPRKKSRSTTASGTRRGSGACVASSPRESAGR